MRNRSALRVVRLALVVLLTCAPHLSSAEMMTLSGRVWSANQEQALVGANVVLSGTPWGTSTNEDGVFLLRVPQDSYRITVQYIGHTVFSQRIDTPQRQVSLDIVLRQAPIRVSDIVKTASRLPSPIETIPAHVSIYPSSLLESRGMLSIDDVLAAEPGIDVNRSSLFSISPDVVLRGTGGSQPGRTLVLLDGVPVNKGDTGEFNWNRINSRDLQRIEVVRGPASALHGSSAMGGVINLLTKRPQPGLDAHVNVWGGQLHTRSVDVSLSGGTALAHDRFLGFYIFGNVLKSDGYIADPEEYRTPYTVKRFLSENSQTAKLLYSDGPHTISLLYQRYDDERGEGEKIRADRGKFREFDTHFVTLQYRAALNRWRWEAKGYYQLEHYARLEERLRRDRYERFDALSDRTDFGLLSSVHYDAQRWGQLSFGVDVRQSRVDGGDIYRTSPDTVANQGRLTSMSGFLQNTVSLIQHKLNLTAGMRWDQVRFDQGLIHSTIPPWNVYNGELDSYTWNALSPKVGLNLRISEKSRLYASVGRAFRAAILDDLSRSGWMSAGPKIANPLLNPETLTNVEIGLEQRYRNARIQLTGYRAVGHDFLYYVDTDQFIFNGRFQLKQRQNVARVHMQGIEASLQVPLGKRLDFSIGWTYNTSVIDDFPERPELVGNMLTYTPQQKAKVALTFQSFVDGWITWEGFSTQFRDDLNTTSISAYDLLHIDLSKQLGRFVRLGITARNVLDTRYALNEFTVNPGRLVMASIRYEY